MMKDDEVEGRTWSPQVATSSVIFCHLKTSQDISRHLCRLTVLRAQREVGRADCSKSCTSLNIDVKWCKDGSSQSSQSFDFFSNLINYQEIKAHCVANARKSVDVAAILSWHFLWVSWCQALSNSDSRLTGALTSLFPQCFPVMIRKEYH